MNKNEVSNIMADLPEVYGKSAER